MQSSLKQEDKANTRSCKLVSEEVVATILDKIEKCTKSDKNYIIEGFPKNLKQALLLQKRGISAKHVLVVNIDSEGLNELCRVKIDALNPDGDIFQKGDMVRQAVLQH